MHNSSCINLWVNVGKATRVAEVYPLGLNFMFWVWAKAVVLAQVLQALCAQISTNIFGVCSLLIGYLSTFCTGLLIKETVLN